MGSSGNASSTSSRGSKASSFMSMWRKPSTMEHNGQGDGDGNSSSRRPFSGNDSDDSGRNTSDSNHTSNNNSSRQISIGHGNSFSFTIGSISDRGSVSSVDDSDIPHSYGHSPGHKRHPSADVVMEASWDEEEDFFEEGDDPRRRSSTMA